MFEVDCPTHGSRVLLSARRIEGIRNTVDGPVLYWRCWCGTRGCLVGGRHRGHRDTSTCDAA